MKKMFVGNLPSEATEESVTELFSEFGKVRSIHLVSDVFTRKCRGFGFIEMAKDEEAEEGDDDDDEAEDEDDQKSLRFARVTDSASSKSTSLIASISFLVGIAVLFL